MTSSHSPSPQDFKFPPVRVDGSLTTLDLDTLMMRSIQSRQPEEAGSSLDDSSYDLLGDGVMDMSDDEAHTASIASTDGPTPDDTSDDFTDDEAEYETGDKDLHDSMHSSRAEIPEQHVDVHARAAWDDSTLTEVPSYLSGSESSWCITLEERPTDKEHVVQGRNVIQSSTDYTDHLPQVFSRYECGEVRLSVKAALSKHPLPTPDAYKILYIGMPEKWAEDITTAQIGTALGAYPSMSKSVMVRGQIEPYVPVPQVYRCTKLDILASHGTPTYILVTLEDGKQLKLGHDSPARSSERPDLVVICHRTQPDPTTEGQDIASSRKILSSAHIPCIELAQVIPHGTASLKNDVTALQVHVEGRNSPDTDYELKAILPLNHRGFSRLEPSQLNRHLALISPHLMKTEHMRQNQKARTSWIGEQVKMFKKKTGAQWPLTRMLISTLVLCALIPALFQGAAFAPMLYQKASQSMSALSLLSETENTIPNITPIAPLSSQVFSSVSSSSATPAMQGLTVIPAPPKQPDQKPKAKNEGVGGFEVHTTGSHQFVLCPSKAFTSNRKKPQLQIQVSRQSQAIPVRYNRTMTGEYIVELEQEYPFNRFDVSIATHTKPLLRQSFEVMLGHNKSTLDQFLDNAKSGLFNTQDALRNASTMAAQQMRLYMTVLNTDAMAASEQILRAQQEVQQQLEVNGRLAMQIPRATWMGLRDMTAPVRTSWAMKKARMNALRLRCKMEMATGLSAEGKEGKQSWACSKVQGEA